MEFTHKPVLFDESIAALQISKGSVFVDGTAGGGGHSGAIAGKLRDGSRLISIDQDPDAVAVLRQRLGSNPQVTVVQDNFAHIADILRREGCDGMDGMLLDLGVSSHQLDTAERGFSYHMDAPLDMRMSQQGLSAADVVNTYSEGDLRRVISRYGEERFAGRIAQNIVRTRAEKPIATTLELAELVKASIPAATRREGPHPARRTFQALRIEVNGELDRLSSALDDAFECLRVGGRLAVITFHSLEDRMVKERFAMWCKGCTCPRDFPVCVCGKTPRARLPFKAKAPTEEELAENPRSRSSRLRVAEKLK